MTLTRRSFLLGSIATALAACRPDALPTQSDAPYTNMKPFLMAQNGATPWHDPAWQAIAAKHDVVVINSWLGYQAPNGMTTRGIIAALKRLNPSIQVGIYTILEEAYNNAQSADSDIYDWLNANNGWYLVNGLPVETYPPDACATQGTAYAQWLAKRNFDLWYNPATLGSDEANPDFWYLDNVRTDSTAGMPQADYRAMHRAHWTAIKSLSPLPLMGNAPNDLSAYPKALNGAFSEAMTGASWSPINQGWDAMMAQYIGQISNTVSPHLVAFNVRESASNHAAILFGLCSALLYDGFFSVTDPTSTTPVWIPEFDIHLGAALGAALNNDGIWTRQYEGGLVTVNPSTQTGTIQ